MWGRQCCGQRVECHCDNVAVVAVINSGQAKNGVLTHLLRCTLLVYISIYVQFIYLGIPMWQQTPYQGMNLLTFCRWYHK